MESATRHIEQPYQHRQAPTILCVDDEPKMLSALNRLFRLDRYNVLLADSAARALQILEQLPVDLVISDMRMPGMDGARFLAETARRWPDTMRILLTGYADLQATIAAINDGGIYRYISKHWEDNDLRMTVRRALEQKALRDERNWLEALTEKQNLELKALNAALFEEKERALGRSTRSPMP
jgi:response regulator RpfG family c-di-GMP phosphodiesterase